MELQIVTLTALVTDLRTKNTAVINAITALSNSRIARNKTLYADKTGLYDIQLEVKKYVKSVFGTTSPQFKQVSGLEFANVKDR